MKKVLLVGMAVTAVMLGVGCSGTDWGKVTSGLLGGQAGLDTETMTAGLKEALQVGIRRAVNRASSEGGYSEQPGLRITLPEKLDKMANALRSVGLGGQVNMLENKMNRAAEEAAAQATPVFIDAIKDMTFADARQILTGPDTAATDYLRRNTTGQLASLYEPIVEKHLRTVGVLDLYNRLHDRYQAVPLVPEVDFKPTNYVTGEALDGLFAMLAQEEQKIRKDPAARTTELLKRVFGG